EAFDASKDGIVLMNHGLITWGATPQEAFDRHIAIVNRAEEFVGKNGPLPREEGAALRLRSGQAPRQVRGTPPVDSSEAKGTKPPGIARLRGALCRDRKVILEFDDSLEVLEFLARPD